MALETCLNSKKSIALWELSRTQSRNIHCVWWRDPLQTPFLVIMRWSRDILANLTAELCHEWKQKWPACWILLQRGKEAKKGREALEPLRSEIQRNFDARIYTLLLSFSNTGNLRRFFIMCSSSQFTINTLRIYLKWLKVFHLANPSEMLKKKISPLEKTKNKVMNQGSGGMVCVKVSMYIQWI